MYVGQTKRNLKLRIAENKAAIRNNNLDYALPDITEINVMVLLPPLGSLDLIWTNIHQCVCVSLFFKKTQRYSCEAKGIPEMTCVSRSQGRRG